MRILSAWRSRILWSPGCLPPSWCRRVFAARCTRSLWTPAGRHTSPWTCGPSEPPRLWFSQTQRAPHCACMSTFCQRGRFLSAVLKKRQWKKHLLLIQSGYESFLSHDDADNIYFLEVGGVFFMNISSKLLCQVQRSIVHISSTKAKA